MPFFYSSARCWGVRLLWRILNPIGIVTGLITITIVITIIAIIITIIIATVQAGIIGRPCLFRSCGQAYASASNLALGESIRNDQSKEVGVKNGLCMASDQT